MRKLIDIPDDELKDIKFLAKQDGVIGTKKWVENLVSKEVKRRMIK